MNFVGTQLSFYHLYTNPLLLRSLIYSVDLPYQNAMVIFLFPPPWQSESPNDRFWLHVLSFLFYSENFREIPPWGKVNKNFIFCDSWERKIFCEENKSKCTHHHPPSNPLWMTSSMREFAPQIWTGHHTLDFHTSGKLNKGNGAYITTQVTDYIPGSIFCLKFVGYCVLCVNQ